MIAVLSVACQGTPATTNTANPLATPTENIPILVDTDVAPDDLVALSFLIASPNVEIAAITVAVNGG